MNHLPKRAALALALTACLVAAEPAMAAETLVNNTRTAATRPTKDKMLKLIVSGSGAATLTVVYSYDQGQTFRPKAAGVDGSAPIFAEKVAYNGATQDGLILEIYDTVQNYAVAVLPSNVSGAVTIDWAQ